VTPIGVRDGDPDALAGLCDVRGPAVLAYCEVVAGRGDRATAAAAVALGSFRANVVAAGDLATLNPEALLISATRHAAAYCVSADVPEACAPVPGLLAARADRNISRADHDWLEEHLESCWACRAPVARFKVADKAYSEPPDTPLAPEVKAAMLAAMSAAAPIRRETAETSSITGYALPTTPSTNGSAAHAEPELPVEEPYTSYDLPAVVVEAPASLDQPTSAYTLPAGDVAPADPSDPSELSAGARRARRRRTRSARGAAAPGAAVAMPAPAAEVPGAGGASLPRPRRQLSGAASGRRRGWLRPAVVLPIALVVVAIIAALAIAGVFGGGEPASSPQSYAPAPSDAPTSTQAAPVVVVPGATAASAAAVEKAKARARAAKSKRKQATTTKPGATPAATAKTPPSAAGTAPAAAAPHAAAPPPPPPPPPPPSGGGKPKIDAGNGATGAEQLPPAKDTSTVPDLAPPVQPAPPPN
jgi:hypothetical protein